MSASVPPADPAASAERETFLSQVASTLLEGREPQALLPAFVRRVGELTGADRVSIYLVDTSNREERLTLRAAWSGPNVPPLPADVARFSVPGIPPTLAAHRSLVAADAGSEKELESEWPLIRRIGTRSIVVSPVVIDGHVRGILVTATVLARRAWTERDVAFLDDVVRRLSAVLKQMDLVAQLGRERDRLRVLVDVSSAVHRSANESEVIDSALAGLLDKLGFPIGGLALVTPDGRGLVPMRAYGTAGLPNLTGRLEIERLSGVRTALETGEPVVLADATDQLGRLPFLDSLLARGFRSVGLFPMKPGGVALGVIGVACDGTTRSIEAADVVTVQSLADFVGVALAQRRATDTAEHAMREAQALAGASQALVTRTASRELLLTQILDALVHHFGQPHARLLLVDPARQYLVESGARGSWSTEPARRGLRLDGVGLTVAAVRDARSLNVSDVRIDDRYLEGWADCRSELCVPLILDGEVAGVLDLQSDRPAAFSDDDVRVLSAFADRVAVALRLSELVAELEERTRVLTAVARATRILNSRLHAPDVLAAMAEEASRAFPRAEGCVVYVANEGGRTLHVASSFGTGRATLGAHETKPIDVEDLRCAGQAFRENRPVFLEMPLEELMAGRPTDMRARVRTMLGETGEIRSLMAAPIRVGDQRLGVIEVLSSRPRAFTEVDAETLALLADQAAIALRNARLIEELQRSNRLKDDFLANLSHEVRTPLTGIVGWAEVLLDLRGEDPDTRRSLTAILGQAETLSRMIGDLIDLSRIENFGVEFQRLRLRLADLIAAALDAIEPSAKKRNVAIHVALPPDLPPLLGDPSRLKQVLWNLMSNAVKFSPAGGRVDLSVRWSHATGLEISVSDEGTGIDPAFQPFVFDRFRQEESATSRRFGGLGIGLAIAKAVVEAHGGTIAVSSEGKGRGARFLVTLPPVRLASSSASTPRPAMATRERYEGDRPSLLVVGEEEARREHLALVGESLGFESLALSPAPGPLQLALDAVPGLVIVDTGDDARLAREVAGRLSALPGGPDVTCVAVAGGEIESYRDELYALGYGAVLARPARRTTVERAIAEARDRTGRTAS